MTDILSKSSPEGAAATPDPKRWFALCIIAIAQLMVVLDATIVNVALPKIMTELELAQSDGQWVVTAYALPFGALLLLGGRIADYLGRKKVLLIGLGGFALASALGGLATSGGMLFAARGLQGAFAALLAPAALSLLTVTFTDTKERAKAFAVFGAIAGGGAAIGLVLGGVLTEYASWQWCLLVNIPIAVIAIALAVPVLKESHLHETGKYDVPGAVLGTLGLGSLVWAFTRAEQGWTSASFLIWIVVAIALLAAFVVVEQRSAEPLLPIRILANRNRAGAYLVGALVGAGMFAVFIFLTYYMQGVLGYEPLPAGVAFLPFSGGVIIGAGVGSALVVKFGPRIMTTIGLIMGVAGLLILSTLEIGSTYAGTILPAVIIMSIGMGFVFMSTTNVALVGVDADDAGVASAMVNTTQQVGGSLGTALLTTFAGSAAASYFADNIGTGLGDPAAEGAVRVAAAVHSYGVAFTWAAVFFGLATIAAATLITAKKADLPTGEVAHAGI